MAKKAKRIRKKLTASERAAYKKKLARLAAEKKEITAKGRAVFAAHKTAIKAISQLKDERARQGLSLADIRDRTGISREAISKLENDTTPNPTVLTIVRYAVALGVKLELNVG